MLKKVDKNHPNNSIKTVLQALHLYTTANFLLYDR